MRVDSLGLDAGDGPLDHLTDLVDALVGLLRRLAQFAVGGGFLWGVIIPLPTYPLSAIHPEGSMADIKQDCIRELCQVEVAGSMV